MIEIARNVTFGRYIDNGSPLTRMDPRAKLLCAVLLIGTFTYISSFSALALALLCCIVLHTLSRLPLQYVLRGFKFVVIFLLVLYVIQVLLYTSPTQHTSLIWQWGPFSLSWEGLAHSAQISIRVIFLYYMASLLMFCTSIVDLTDGTESLLSPLQKLGLPVSEVVMIFVIAIKFVPILITEVERLTKAQATRGVRFDKGNPIQRIYRFGSLLVPLFLSSFRRVETLTIAMEARCYRGGYRGWRRSKRRALHMTRADLFALFGTLLACAIIIAVNILVHV